LLSEIDKKEMRDDAFSKKEKGTLED